MSEKRDLFINIALAIVIFLCVGLSVYNQNTYKTRVEQLESEIAQVKKYLTQIEYVFGIKDGFHPESWMFQPATEPCIPGKDMGCEE